MRPLRLSQKPVLHQLSRRDEKVDDRSVGRPGQHGVPGELGPIVRGGDVRFLRP
jgi:hypothetical protein